MGNGSEFSKSSPVSSETVSINNDEVNLLPSREIYLIGQPETPRVWVKLRINGKVVRGLLDTGAETTVLHESLVYKLFGANPHVTETNTMLKGIGESSGVKVVGEVTSMVDINGIRLEDMSMIIVPLCINMASPLILGMEFLRMNRFTLCPGDRTLSNRSPDGSGYDWIIDEDGNAVEIRLNRSKCVASSSVAIEPHSSIAADICLADPVLRDYSDRSKAAQTYLIECSTGPVVNNFDIHDGLVSSDRMKVLYHNPSSVVRHISKGDVVAVATTVLELDSEDMPEFWDISQLESEVKLGNLTAEQKQSVLNVLSGVSTVFSKDEYDVNAAAVTAHTIHLTDDTPVYMRPRRFPEPINEEMERQCLELEAIDIIERSVSPWSAPVVPLRKGDGKLRLCIDYRRLNSQTKPDRSPIPCLTDAVYGINRPKFFTSLDLVKGYYQIPLSPESRELTAFSTAYSHFQFKRLSFGLRNAPATFQREIQTVLAEYPKTNVIVYFDDILIMEDTFEAHLELVSKVLHTLGKHGMKIKPSKCQWFAEEVDFLGHTISSSGLRKQDSYVAKVMEFPLPQTVKELQQFLGLVNFQRKFVKDASIVQRPLSELTGGKKNTKIDWTEERREAFEEIKKRMREDIKLAFPCYGEEAEKIVLWVDASDGGAGACLMQRQDGEDRVIAYASMSFSLAQRKYATVDKELAALRWGVKAFKSFLYGIEFIIRTDHQPLVYLHSMRVVDNRLARTLSDLSEFNFSIEYVPGSTNTAADALSRVFIHPVNEKVSTMSSQLPSGLQLDGEPSPGGGDSLLICLHRWLLANSSAYNLKSAQELREQLIDELGKNPAKYGVKSSSKTWRQDVMMRRLPGQLPPVEILLVCSYLYSVKINVFYWMGDPVTFVDWRMEPTMTVSLQCLAGIHYNLLKQNGGINKRSKPVYYCSQPAERSVFQVSVESEDSLPTLCNCRLTAHPRIPVGVAGKYFCAVLDTGAEISLIRRDVFDELSKSMQLTLDSSQLVYIEGYSGLMASMTGTVDIELELLPGMKTRRHTFAVVDVGVISQCFLLGIDFLSAHSLAIDAAEDSVVQLRPHMVRGKLIPYRAFQIRYPVAHVACTSNEDIDLGGAREQLPAEVTSLVSEFSVRREQEIDPIISMLIENAAVTARELWPSELSSFGKSSYDFYVKEGLLYCKVGRCQSVVVSWSLLVRIVVSLHSALAHIGRDKMLHLLRQHVFHPNLYMAVRDVCQSCPDCQIMKVSRQVYLPPMLKIVTSFPFELVAADVVLFPRTSDGFIGCIILVDHNSKWISAVPIKNKTSKSMVNALKLQMLPFLPRCPRKIMTDNGSEFTSKEFNQVLDEFGIQHVYTTPYRPQSNGCIERVNRTVGSFLRSLGASSDWTDRLTAAVMIYNTTLHQSIGVSPGSYLLSKSHETVDWPAVSIETKQFWDYGHSKFNPFVEDQSVIRKLPVKGHRTAAKFEAKYDGPYKVVKVNPNELTYVVRKSEQTQLVRVHHSQLAPWVDPPNYLLPFLEGGQYNLGVFPGVERSSCGSDDSSSADGDCLLALSSDSDCDSVESRVSVRVRRESSSDRVPRAFGSGVLLGSDCLLADGQCDRDEGESSLIKTCEVGRDLRISDDPIFSDLAESVACPGEALFQDLPVEQLMETTGGWTSALLPGREHASDVTPVGGDEVSPLHLSKDPLQVSDDEQFNNELFDLGSSGDFLGFVEESLRRSQTSRHVLDSVRGFGGDFESDPHTLHEGVPLRRVRFNSSPLENDILPAYDSVLSEQCSAILDWDASFEEWEVEDEVEVTPSSDMIHDANNNAVKVTRGLQNLIGSIDGMLDAYLESGNSGSYQSEDSVPSVSQWTPIINEKILSRIRTRSRGPVADHPHVLNRPLEYKKGK